MEKSIVQKLMLIQQVGIKMIGLKETTKWDKVNHFKVPSHTYILNKAGELVAYLIEGTNEYRTFTKPIKGFSKSRRTFKEVELNQGGPFLSLIHI